VGAVIVICAIVHLKLSGSLVDWRRRFDDHIDHLSMVNGNEGYNRKRRFLKTAYRELKQLRTHIGKKNPTPYLLLSFSLKLFMFMSRIWLNYAKSTSTGPN
jgi:hypothetical protein